jgi:hypothetical protein
MSVVSYLLDYAHIFVCVALHCIAQSNTVVNLFRYAVSACRSIAAGTFQMV